MKKLALVIMTAMLGLAGAADAQQAPGTLRQACAADAKALCPGLKPMDQRKCLMTNISKVSQDCGTALANAKSAMREYAQACNADIRQYCGNQPMGPQRRQCITANETQFSQACQSALEARGMTPAAPAQ